MKSALVASFLVFSSAVMPMAAFAAEGSSAADTRYFVESTSGFWRGALSARHEFADGFTADLSDLQLRFAKLAGLKPVAVKKYSILETAAVAEVRETPTSQIPWGVALVTSAGAQTSPAASVSVAVLDTGIAAHPDLARRISDCRDFTEPGVGVTIGSCEDRNGHGTHVAGIIAADGGADGKGIFGVAPESSLLVYKVCDDTGSCWSDDIAVAIRAAADAGTQVINLSLGSDAASSLIADAVTYAGGKGSLVVAAAGNDGPYPASIDYPAALPGVVAVAALDATLVTPDWSSRGINDTTGAYSVQESDVELAAPGVNVESTSKEGGYAITSGTSMSAAYVSGFLARNWQLKADKPADATRLLLHELAVDVAPVGDDPASGWGTLTHK